MEVTKLLNSRPSLQAPLFPLDTWGAEGAFAVLDSPYPGIARAMVGALTLGCELDADDVPLRCLWVADDLMSATCTRVTSAHLKSPEVLWQYIVRTFEQDRMQPFRVCMLGTNEIAPDCVARWSDLAFWVHRSRYQSSVHRSEGGILNLMDNWERDAAIRPQAQRNGDPSQIWPEIDAQTILQGELVTAISDVLNALKPNLCEAIICRPRLSVSVACRLVRLAQPHGPAAQTYAVQALKTESLGLLHLVASGYPEHESRVVGDAIFSGTSLSDALEKLGIAKADHRRSLRALARRVERVGTLGAGIGDCLMPGWQWLSAMRLVKSTNLPFPERFKEFCRLAPKVFSLNLRRPKTVSLMIQWCLLPSKTQADRRLDLLIGQAEALVAATRGLTSVDVSFDQAILVALELLPKKKESARFTSDLEVILNPKDLVILGYAVPLLSGRTIPQLLQPIFDLHPRIPGEFRAPEPFTIYPIDNFDVAIEHGRISDICLKSASSIIWWVVEGAALYGVMSDGKVAGTIALGLDEGPEHPGVLVLDVTGVANSKPSPELSSLARDLAGSWKSNCQIQDWHAHARRCEEWTQQARGISRTILQDPLRDSNTE